MQDQSPFRSLFEMSGEYLRSVAAAEGRYYGTDKPGEYALILFRALETIPSHGMPVNLYRHSLQTASRCLRAGSPDDLVVVALLHDIGEAFSPLNHGAIAAELLRPFVPDAYIWLLEKHAIFQEFHYADSLGQNRHRRSQFKEHPYYELTRKFCEEWDQSSFDPDYEEIPLADFVPLVRGVFARPIPAACRNKTDAD